MRFLALVLTLAFCGCVERKLIVRSDPPDVAVYVDGTLRGRTTGGSLEIPFDHYGTRTLTVRREGYLPVRREVELDPTWYQYFPIGLVTDLLWPGTITDEHSVELELEIRPEPEAPEEVVREAEHFAESESRRP